MSVEKSTEQYFKGRFIATPESIAEKLQSIKAFIFDWDGVFNNAHKNVDGNSTFSETDSMGTNLMRFNNYLKNNVQPIAAIITGENNQCAFSFAKRENYDVVYYRIKHKETALLHLCKQYNLKPSEVLFVFDDVLDFSAAKLAGLRIMVNHDCNPLLIQFAIENNLVDYVTKHDGSNGAIRETSELIMHLSKRFNETIESRMQFSDTYKTYINGRNATPDFYTITNNEITQQII
jgi:3-deoxy-D-manno-octulosonate 8-phosphate phosphatase (KDO 8-P phosphatase)